MAKLDTEAKREKDRARRRRAYHLKKKLMLERNTAALKANPSSPTRLLRKSPTKSVRKVKDADSYADSILTWMEKKGTQ